MAPPPFRSWRDRRKEFSMEVLAVLVAGAGQVLALVAAAAAVLVGVLVADVLLVEELA